jgi:hypothetical protein
LEIKHIKGILLLYCSEGAAPSSAGSNIPEPATYKKKYEKEESFVEEEVKEMFDGPVPLPPVISEADTGRKPDLPTCPIIFVAGKHLRNS